MSTASFLMSNGMMWTLGAHSEPKERYDYIKKTSMLYDNLSPRVVARYVAAQRDRTYKFSQTDCQTVALELAQRLSLHGRRLQVGMASVHFNVVHPARGSAWLPHLRQHLRALLHNHGGASLTMTAETSKVGCPTAEPTLAIHGRFWSLFF